MGRRDGIDSRKLVHYNLEQNFSQCLLCNKILKGHFKGNIKRHYHTFHKIEFERILIQSKIEDSDIEEKKDNNSEHTQKGDTYTNVAEISNVNQRESVRYTSMEEDYLGEMVKIIKDQNALLKSVVVNNQELAHEIKEDIGEQTQDDDIYSIADDISNSNQRESAPYTNIEEPSLLKRRESVISACRNADVMQEATNSTTSTLNLPCDPLEIMLNQRDDCVIYGEHVTCKLRRYTLRTRNIVQHHINSILFEADMGNYDN